MLPFMHHIPCLNSPLAWQGGRFLDRLSVNTAKAQMALSSHAASV